MGNGVSSVRTYTYTPAEAEELERIRLTKPKIHDYKKGYENTLREQIIKDYIHVANEERTRKDIRDSNDYQIIIAPPAEHISPLAEKREQILNRIRHTYDNIPDASCWTTIFDQRAESLVKTHTYVRTTEESLYNDMRQAKRHEDHKQTYGYRRARELSQERTMQWLHNERLREKAIEERHRNNTSTYTSQPSSSYQPRSYRSSTNSSYTPSSEQSHNVHRTNNSESSEYFHRLEPYFYQETPSVVSPKELRNLESAAREKFIEYKTYADEGLSTIGLKEILQNDRAVKAYCEARETYDRKVRHV